MYINWFTRIIFIHNFLCCTINWVYQEFSIFYQRNGKSPLPRWKQGNYPVIPIYDLCAIPGKGARWQEWQPRSRGRLCTRVWEYDVPTADWKPPQNLSQWTPWPRPRPCQRRLPRIPDSIIPKPRQIIYGTRRRIIPGGSGIPIWSRRRWQTTPGTFRYVLIQLQKQEAEAAALEYSEEGAASRPSP